MGDTLTLSSVGTKQVDAGIELVNNGSIVWTGAGGIRLNAAARLVNRGLMTRVAPNGTASMDSSVTLDGVFVNEGTFINSSTSVAGVSLAGAGLTVNNLGVLDNQSDGNVQLPAGFTNNGTLTGRGAFSIAGTGLVNAGTLAPGSNGIGTLRLISSNTLVLGSTSTLAIDIGSVGSHDLLAMDGSGFGAATLGGTLALNCLGACSLAVGDVITVMTGASSLAGSFSQVTLQGFATGAFDVVYDFNSNALTPDAVKLVVTQAVSAVPEPGAVALWLAGLGLMGLVVLRQRVPR